MGGAVIGSGWSYKRIRGWKQVRKGQREEKGGDREGRGGLRWTGDGMGVKEICESRDRKREIDGREA